MAYVRRVKKNVRAYYKSVSKCIRRVQKFVYEDEQADIHKAKTVLLHFVKPFRMQQQKGNDVFQGVEQDVTKAVNEAVKELLESVCKDYLRFFVMRMESLGRTAKAQRKFVQKKLQEFNTNNNDVASKGKPIVLIINSNHIESTSILGVRHCEFVSPPKTYGDYLQFRGRVLRACASHVRSLPQAKRSVTFHMNIATLDKSGAREIEKQLGLQTPPVKYTVDELLYAKLLQERTREEKTMYDLVEKHAIDAGLYSTASTPVYEFKKKMEQATPTLSAATSAAATSAAAAAAATSAADMTKWVKGYVKEQKSKQIEFEEQRQDTLDTTAYRIAAIVLTVLGILKQRTTSKTRHQIHKYIKTKLDEQDARTPTFVLKQGSLAQFFNGIKNKAGSKMVSLKPFDAGDHWVTLVLGLLKFLQIDLKEGRLESTAVMKQGNDRAFGVRLRSFQLDDLDTMFGKQKQINELRAFITSIPEPKVRKRAKKPKEQSEESEQPGQSGQSEEPEIEKVIEIVDTSSDEEGIKLSDESSSEGFASDSE